MKVYDHTKSIKENAVANNCTEANVRKYIQTHHIDRRGDEQIRKFKTITKLRGKGWTLSKIAEETGYSVSTVRKYLSNDFSWKNNVVLAKQSLFQRGQNADCIKSVDTDQHNILRSILTLYVPSGCFDCDLTYGEGKFYKKIPQPIYKFDISPRSTGVLPLERAHELENESLDSIVIDLPFIIRRGSAGNSIIADRYSHFQSYEDLTTAYDDVMGLAARLLKQEGIMIVKTQDVSDGKQQIWTHQIVERLAESLNFDLEDLFIKVATHVQTRAYLSLPRHARRYHSYFYVLRKRQ